MSKEEYNMSKARELDKFYTLPEVAKSCIDLIDGLDDYDFCIEPSAGNGAFSKQLKNCRAYDILPEVDGVEKKNWFEVEKQSGRFIVVGNPPFGSRNTLSKNFIKHSVLIGATTIAFILPDVFSKISNQPKTVFPEEWRLIVEHKLPDNSFTLEGEVYHVPCTFYVWTKEPGELNLRQVRLEATNDFEFSKRGSTEADFTINGNSGKIKDLSEVTNPKAEHYIKAKGKDVNELRKIFNKCDFSFMSSVNGGNAWIGQQEILKAYYSSMGVQNEK